MSAAVATTPSRAVSDRDLKILWKERFGSHTAHAKHYGARNWTALCGVDLTPGCHTPSERSRRCSACRKVRKQLADAYPATPQPI